MSRHCKAIVLRRGHKTSNVSPFLSWWLVLALESSVDTPGQMDSQCDSDATPQETICISNRHKYDQRLWDVLTFVLLYLAPLAAMAYLYSRIAAVLWFSGRNLGPQQPAARRGVIKLIVTVVSGGATHQPPHRKTKTQNLGQLNLETKG